MTMDASQRIPQLAGWLSETDIAGLVLDGPGIALRLHRDPASGRVQGKVGHGCAGTPAGTAPGGSAAASGGNAVARARSVGILRHSHPQSGLALAPVGTSVRAGQALALLQVGPLLLPVLAEQDGKVVSQLAPEGAPVGYGDPVLQLHTAG